MYLSVNKLIVLFLSHLRRNCSKDLIFPPWNLDNLVHMISVVVCTWPDQCMYKSATKI